MEIASFVGRLADLVLTPDARLVVFLAHVEPAAGYQILVAPPDGSLPARTLPTTALELRPELGVRVDARSERLLFAASTLPGEAPAVFSIALSGAEPPVQLTGPIALPFDPSRDPYALTPDEEWIVYRAATTTGALELRSARTDGSGQPVTLSQAAATLEVLALGSDPVRVVFTADWMAFTAPVDGSTPAQPLTGELIYTALAAFDLAGEHILHAGFDGAVQVSPADGSAAPVDLGHAAWIWSPRGGFDPAAIVPLGEGFLFRSDPGLDALPSLHFAAADGSSVRELAPEPIPRWFPFGPSLRNPSPTPGVVFYQDGALHSVGLAPLDRPMVLVPPRFGGFAGSVGSFELAPSGERVVYVAREEGDHVAELYSVSPGLRRERRQLHPDLPRWGGIHSVRLTSDGGRALFTAVSQAPGLRGLYSVPVDASAPAVELGPPGLDVASFELAPNDRWVAAIGPGLFLAPTDGSAPARLVSAELAVEPSSARFSADGSRVAFLSRDGWLHAVPTEGSATPVRIAVGERRMMGDFQLAPDGGRVVFRTHEAGTAELYVGASDGGTPPIRLSADLAAEGDVLEFQVLPEAGLVVYRADASQDERFELFVAPLDGSAAPARLHPALVRHGDVTHFQVAPGGGHVVYRADARTDSEFELFSLALEPGAVPVRLSGSLVAGGDVLGFRVSPDGQRVAYRADQEVDGLIALYSTSIRGARGGVRLSRALVPGGDVQDFQISADSSTVAFTAERDPAGALALLAAPLRGGEKAIELGEPGVLEFALAADGSRAVWRGSQDYSPAELFGASVRLGSTPLQR